MRVLLVIPALLALSACDTPVGTDIARSQAKSVVNKVAAEKLPGQDVTPVTDCIIDNASGSEIVTLAKASVAGVTPSTTTLIFDIARRPDTVQCLVTNVGPIVVAKLALGS